ncbi:MAG: RluA family pseudouridine synthase [Pirellulaceae bacterium]
MTKSNSKRSASPSTVYHLRAQHTGLTLAAALKDLDAAWTWGQVKKWIAGRHVQVNGNLCLDEARRVTEKDVVKLWKEPLPKPVQSSDLRITHLDEHLIVVEKPAGVTSVRHVQERKLSTRRRQLQPTLEELLPPVLAKIQRLRWPPLPPVGMNRGRKEQSLKGGRRKHSLPIHNAKKLPPELQVIPVHRLDRDTSGLMLFARTREAEQRLVAMFRRHTIERQYIGICHGTVEAQTFRSHLVRDRGDGIRGSLLAEAPAAHTHADRSDQLSEGQAAITHVLSSEPLANGAYSLIRCRLETGRTHQIRIHLSEAGHMLCGDKIYNIAPDGTRIADQSCAPRHALHSDRLTFTHPFTGQHLQFEMSLPRDLAGWLKNLQSSHSGS